MTRIRPILCLISLSMATLSTECDGIENEKGKSRLRDKLRYFELVEVERQVVKRGAAKSDTSKYNRIEKVFLHAFGRSFNLYLTPKRGLLDKNLRAVSVGSNGHKRPIHIDPDQFFEGHLHGASQSRVSASFDGQSALTATVYVENETYYFEPAWRHIPDSLTNTVLAYRASDVEVSIGSRAVKGAFCGFTRDTNGQFSGRNFSSIQRTRRQLKETKKSYIKEEENSIVNNRCPLKIVADYRFYELIGNRSLPFSARYVINMIDRVNMLYTSTDWGVDSKERRLINMGFMIRDISIHTAPTPVLPNQTHYNMYFEQQWPVDQFLTLFSEAEGSSQFCLVHLFTAQSFKGGVLGLAYIPDTKLASAGGICSPPTYRNQKKVYFNTALCSAKSSYGDTVITREADIVAAHEFGHNWGSYHDPEDAECSPSYKSGGSYIMHTYSVSGYDPNNNKFSPCSRRLIGATLAARAGLCFERSRTQLCGNGRVEKGEQCDVASLLSSLLRDRCCTDRCMLRPNAQCSPKNSPCCGEDCKFKARTELCLTSNQLHCKQASYCTGDSGECPEPAKFRDGASCLEDGQCRHGVCITFCEKFSHKPCICENPSDSCYRCCRAKDRADCRPYSNPGRHILPNGTRCIHGYCERGICRKEVTDVVSHLWRIIERIDRTTFWKFVQDNLVALVIIFSLMVWIPASLLVNHIDEKGSTSTMTTAAAGVDNQNELVREPRVMSNDTNVIDIVRQIKRIQRPLLTRF